MSAPPLNPNAICDFRIEGTNCDGSRPIIIIYSIHLATCFIFFAFGCYILYDRVWRKRQKLMEWSRREMAIQPRPTEMFVLNSLAFYLLRAILCVLVITGADLGNRVTEENWGNAAWSFAASTIVFYLIGIIFATPHTFNDMDELNIRPSIYMPSPMRLNIVLFSLTLIPLIINHTLSTLAGSAYEAGDLNGYSRMVAGVYIMWGAVAFIIMLLYVVFGRQLLTILSKNMVGLEQHVPFRGAMESKTGLTQASRMRELRASYRKIKGVVITMIIMMPVITLVCVVLAILRARILSNVGVMIAFSCLWVNACGIAIGIALIFMGYGK